MMKPGNRPEKWMGLMQIDPDGDLVAARALLNDLRGWTWRGDQMLQADLETVLAFMTAIRLLAAGAVVR